MEIGRGRGFGTAPTALACVINPSETKGSPRTALRVSGRDRLHPTPPDRKSATGGVRDGACVNSGDSLQREPSNPQVAEISRLHLALWTVLPVIKVFQYKRKPK